MQRAVFLDRDGVLNRSYLQADGKTHPPANRQELEILPGVFQACRGLRRAGFLLIVVTNQPDVARGLQRREEVEAINATLRRQVPVDEIVVCYHDNQDKCQCRKPRPGMLLDAARTWRINFSKSFLVGDRWTDIEAGRRAGCKTVLVNGDPYPSANTRCLPDFRTTTLEEAVKWILRQPIQGAK